MTTPATTLATLTRRAHERYANRAAVHDGDGWLTFAQLGAMARRTANRLLRLGCRPGDRVVIALENRPEVLAVEHALFLTGMVRVAVSSRLHGREIAGIAEDCGSAVVVCEPGHLEPLAGADTRAIVAPGGGDVDLAALVGPGASESAPPVPGPEPGDIAALMYTSGTTGEPKGAIVTHRAWVAMVRAFWAELPPCGPGDVVLHAAPMSHFGGSAGSAYTFRGAAAVPVRRFDPDRVLHLLDEHRVAALPLVPTMLNALTAAAEATGTRPASLRAVPYGGAPIAAQSLVRAEAVFGEVLYQCYGLSEALAPLTVLPAREHRGAAGQPPPAHLASAGRPVAEVELSIVDDQGDEVAAGVDGEVRVRGDVVMPGYWGRPDQSTEVLSDGWFRTGDIGHLDADGRLYLVDRRRDVIVSGGFNVYPSEVERVIAELPDVREVVVFGVPHERWGEGVAAAVVRRPGSTLSADDVVNACRSRLAGYKKPVLVEFADHLPVSSTGKLHRREIRDRHWAGRNEVLGR